MPDDPLKGAVPSDTASIQNSSTSPEDTAAPAADGQAASLLSFPPRSERALADDPAAPPGYRGAGTPGGPGASVGTDQGGVPPPELRSELLRECEALVLFLGRYGSAFADATGMPAAMQNLADLVATMSGRVPTPTEWKNLVLAYSEVTKITYAKLGVNGRSILDTWGIDGMFGRPTGAAGHVRGVSGALNWSEFSGRRKRPLRFAACLAASALFLQWLVAWAGRVSDPKALEWYLVPGYGLATDLAPLLIPAAWGGMGACIFLMKKLSDKLGDFAFEEIRLKGDGTRIFLGAILGVAVVQIFFPSYSANLQVGEISFGPTTTAFVAGLGVKPIYAAFETVAESIAERITGKKTTVG